MLKLIFDLEYEIKNKMQSEILSFNPTTHLVMVDYSEKAYAIYFDPNSGWSKAHSEALKDFGARYNGNLRQGKGWILSKQNKNLENIRSYINHEAEQPEDELTLTDKEIALLDYCRDNLSLVSGFDKYWEDNAERYESTGGVYQK